MEVCIDKIENKVEKIQDVLNENGVVHVCEKLGNWYHFRTEGNSVMFSVYDFYSMSVGEMVDFITK